MRRLHARLAVSGWIRWAAMLAVAPALAWLLSGVVSRIWFLWTGERDVRAAFVYSFILGAVVLRILLAPWMSFLRREYRSYIRNLLLDKGLLYILIEHEPAEHVVASARRGTIRLPAQSPLGSRFSDRLSYIVSAYSRAARAVGYDPYPPRLIWADKLLTLVLIFAGVLLPCIAPAFDYVPHELAYKVLCVVMMFAVAGILAVLSFLQEARNDGVILALLDIFGRHGTSARLRRDQARLAGTEIAAAEPFGQGPGMGSQRSGG